MKAIFWCVLSEVITLDTALVVVVGGYISEGGISVYYLILKLTLHILLCLDYVVLQAIPVVYDHPLCSAKCTLALAAHTWYCKEIIGHSSECRV
jgi:hypothetical protein